MTYDEQEIKEIKEYIQLLLDLEKKLVITYNEDTSEGSR
ncbi:MAG: hypothetical protein JWO54_828 [Candidatus Saccharibacteria bacterium]|nr:hypothetical protein [Candidatus Saccharibacteria bacterium]